MLCFWRKLPAWPGSSSEPTATHPSGQERSVAVSTLRSLRNRLPSKTCRPANASNSVVNAAIGDPTHVGPQCADERSYAGSLSRMTAWQIRLQADPSLNGPVCFIRGSHSKSQRTRVKQRQMTVFYRYIVIAPRPSSITRPPTLISPSTLTDSRSRHGRPTASPCSI